MKITKPALYRYFKNKEDLLNCMKSSLIDKFDFISRKFIEESRGKNGQEIIYSYVKNFFEFFAENHYYFLFFYNFFCQGSHG